MKVTRLRLAGLRAFEQAEFEFDANCTLLVGVNGVGKTTVLDALRVAMSRLLPQFTASKSRPDTFTFEDIRVGDGSLTVELDLELNGATHHWLLHKQRMRNASHREGVVREQTLDTPDRETVLPEFGKQTKRLKASTAQPVALYFATRRSMFSDEQVKIGRAHGGQAAAYADSLSPRPLRLAYLAEWMLAQERLSAELPRAANHLDAFRNAAQRFLPDCKDLRTSKQNERPRLIVTKGTVSLDVRQLSDGERSMLALALDIAQRLSQANPGLEDPIRDGSAVVLIDELDMHMHPQWQRQVMALLESTFPNCQFIATTHSPQIIGETQPDRIIVLQAEEGGRIIPRRCGQAYGLDANAVLELIMGTATRAEPVQETIAAAEAALDEGELEQARKQLADLRTLLHGDDPTVVDLEATINNLQALGDATDQ